MAWLPLAVAITGICLLVYGAVQQNYRQSLNDPQIQMAEDAAYALHQGEVPAGVVPRNVPLIDMRQSLAPWIAVYDNAGKPLEASAFLDGAPPQPPLGVLEAASQGKGIGPNPDENRVSWQAKGDVRQAIVVVSVPGANANATRYVVAGRNMREVENREGDLTTFVGLAWLVLLVATFATKAFSKYFA